ncbi:DUF1571 domain-containing protein [Fulvivirga ulvae]|uniref:DUF1571 domain-containing protein n=1 Tax=Fulvivirga ulvae TaxID=2904245 RepID=UPI001F413EA7|nr:DUF1571 domain-containing protein [Fulvivirga ulvae]UII31133.1 DUF1571 domain-containing protein [Fulvivirga ulvae]
MKKMERIEGKMTSQTSFVKLQRNPFKVYTRQEYPNDGLEVLFKEGDHSALINPNGFPWLNLKLDPHGSRMRKEQHHTIHDAGYDQVVAILEHLFNKYQSQIHSLTSLESTTWKNKNCWQVEFKNPNFKYSNYTVGRNETISSIADKYMLSSHMILEANKSIEDYYDVSEGQVITIPNDYSPKMLLVIDKQIMVPLVMKVYDDKGLYEHYEFSDIKINPVIKDSEFSEDYPEYGF